MERIPSDIQSICGASLEEIITIAHQVLRTYVSMPDRRESHRTGCYLTIAHIPTEEVLATVRIGIIPPHQDDNPEYGTKARKYWSLSIEKARRLLGHLLDNGHISSAQSADPENEKYPGAICGTDIVISISGFTPDGDESISLIIGRRIGQVTESRVADVIAISHNAEYEDLAIAWSESGLATVVA